MDEQIAGSGKFWRILISLIIGAIIGFGLAYYWYEIKPKELNPDASKVADEMLSADLAKISQINSGLTLVATDEGAVIEVSDQSAGQTVLVDKVVLTGAGWVAVREDLEGQLGKILGAQRLDAGIHGPVLVDLLRQTVAGKNYYLVLYRDDGDKIFNQQLDSIIERDNKVILGVFVAE